LQRGGVPSCCFGEASLFAQQAPVFRGTTENVPVYVTVTDKASRLVTSLAKDDFNVFDNGRQQPLAVFDNSPRPVRLIVMLDVSGSMYGNLAMLRAACGELFAHLGAADEARVGSFGQDIVISPAFVDLVKGFGIKEIARTGPTAMSRGIKTI
jgi:hypothetical protein